LSRALNIVRANRHYARDDETASKEKKAAARLDAEARSARSVDKDGRPEGRT
jgi:hypothetical protein